MDDRVNLQIPVSLKLKVAAEKAASEMGFSSLQETVRVFLKKMASRSLNFTFVNLFDEVYLSRESAERYDEIAKEIEEKKGVKKAKSVDDLFKKLNS